MKKLLTLGLSLLAVVAVLSLSACGQQDSGGGDSTTTTEQPAQPTQQSGEGSNATPTPATPEGGTQTQSGAEGGGQ
jgi:ABC-type oligopeptide transport system substrate-binding subunit